MRSWGIGLLLTSFFAVPVYAADMPAKMPVKAPMVAAPYNWSGFYIGVNVGGSWGSQDNALATAGGVTVLTNTAKPNGVIGGGQVGYNWQFNQVVLGLEADFQGSGQKGDGDPLYFSPGIAGIAGGGAFSIPYSDKLEWFGTVRGRTRLCVGPLAGLRDRGRGLWRRQDRRHRCNWWRRHGLQRLQNAQRLDRRWWPRIRLHEPLECQARISLCRIR